MITLVATDGQVVISSKKLAGSSVHTIRTVQHIPLSVEKVPIIFVFVPINLPIYSL